MAAVAAIGAVSYMSSRRTVAANPRSVAGSVG